MAKRKTREELGLTEEEAIDMAVEDVAEMEYQRGFRDGMAEARRLAAEVREPEKGAVAHHDTKR